MTLRFNRKLILCGELYSSPRYEAPRLVERTASFFGNDGEVEIAGGISGRGIDFTVWIHDKDDTDTAKKLEDELRKLELRIGESGEIEYTMFGETRKIKVGDCTLRAVERNAETGPQYDTAGVLGQDVGDRVWWQECVLRFRQLVI